MDCIGFGDSGVVYILISVWNGCDIFFENKKTTTLSCLFIDKVIYVDF